MSGIENNETTDRSLGSNASVMSSTGGISPNEKPTRRIGCDGGRDYRRAQGNAVDHEAACARPTLDLARPFLHVALLHASGFKSRFPRPKCAITALPGGQ